MAWYECLYGGSGEVCPQFIFENTGSTVTISNAVIGDYYIVSCGNSGATMGITVTGADIVYNEIRAMGSNSCTRTVAIKATSTTITITRSQSSGAIMVTKLDIQDAIYGTEHIESCFLASSTYASRSKTSTDGTYTLATYADSSFTLLKDCVVTIGVYSTAPTSTTQTYSAGTTFSYSTPAKLYIIREA